MKWDEFNKMTIIDTWEMEPRSQVNIECPKCGAKLFRRNDIVLTSYPPKYQYECDKCNWVGYAPNVGGML
jgi:predicted RNA-binding Zn-ribbon protein involved in translation (DUF1610 family)